MKKLVCIAAVVLNTQFACKDNPVSSKPENRNPIMFSATVFPSIIGLSDSAVVICNAMDPDSDTLVYDWITDGRLKIKGSLTGEDFLYNTHENYQIFYPKQSPNFPSVDTVWVQCFARDGKGGVGGGNIVLFVVKQN